MSTDLVRVRTNCKKFEVFHHCVSLAPHVEHSFRLGTSLWLGRVSAIQEDRTVIFGRLWQGATCL